MNIAKEQTVGEIVAEDYRTAGVFRKFGLDFCCGGGRSLVDACKQKELNIEDLLEEVNKITQENEPEHNYKEWSPAFLIDYIINNHHHFVRKKLPEIKAYATKVAKVHGRTHSVLNEMLEVFLVLKKEMLSHLEAEEQVLFPYIKKMQNNEIGEDLLNYTTAHAIEMMEKEHDDAGQLMARLEKMSNGFTPPEGACTTFRVYFQSLEGFRDDLHKHVHLENNILFPKALKMEKSLN